MDNEIVKTPEDVFQEILKWIQDANTVEKLAENAESHIGEKVGRSLKPLETSCVELQYVKALLITWARNSLEKAVIHLEDETIDIGTEMSMILDELNSIHSFEDINTEEITGKSQFWMCCVGDYFQLIVKQIDLFKNTPIFAILLKHYFNKLKSCFNNKIFSRCRDNIVSDGVNGSTVQEFLLALSVFLTTANEDKDLQDVVKDYMFESNITAMNWETVWHEWINILIENMKTISQADNETSDWLQRFKSAAFKIEKWTPKLECLIRETCKNSLLPETTIKIREEYGRKMILINGVAIFVSKMLVKMKELKANDEKVEEIQIVGESSIHIDCDLEKEFWHGINVGIVTDKLVICSDKNGRLWDVSGKNAEAISNMKEAGFRDREEGESGGNVRIKCNQIIGADQWTIVSNGGNRNSIPQWSIEEFKEVFSPILPHLEEENGENLPDLPEIVLYNRLVNDYGFVDVKNYDVATEQWRDIEKRKKGDTVQSRKYLDTDEEKSDLSRRISNFEKIVFRNSTSNEIRFLWYLNRKTKKRHTLILCEGLASDVGGDGCGGEIILELSNKEHAVPPIGMFLHQVMAAGGVVYKATGSDGITPVNGDVGFIHNGDKDKEIQQGQYFGFEIDQKLVIKYYNDKKKLQRDKIVSYVKISSDSEDRQYATIAPSHRKMEDIYIYKACKKNAVIRQSLVSRFSKINERKQMQESLWKMFSCDLLEETRSQNVDQLMEEIQNNDFECNDLDNQQFNQEKIGCIKPAPGLTRSAPSDSNVSPKISGKRRSLNQDNVEIRQILNDFITKHSEELKSDIWKEMSDQRKKESIEQIVDFEKKMILMFSYINGRRKCGKKEKIMTRKWDKEINLDDNIKSLESLGEFLYDFECAVGQLRKSKDNKFELRDTQILAILTLLFERKVENESNTKLAEVSTGEGKSLIVAAVAIALAINGGMMSRIDVFTTNDLLATRDSKHSVAEGGLKDLYEYFSVTVSNNCSQSEDDRKASYTASVLYGRLANFQRDYLLDDFYGRNIRGDRDFSYAIIDEVDCMLLDQGNNTLYLSHDIPGMETLESLYVYIWERIRNSTIDTNNSEEKRKESIKSEVFYDLYGVTTIDDLKSVHNPLSDLEKQDIWNHLIKEKVIDLKGRLLIEDCHKISEEAIKYSPAELCGENMNAKLVFHFRKVANRQRRIRIPAHLLDFVDRNLDTWLNSAFQAVDLRRDEDYVIDRNRTDTSFDLNPQVIIIDPDTGTDQTSSQWDGALHQFVQLKEGCKLTLQSLKAVFFSNAMYINRHCNTLGVSGTLGSEQEKILLQDTFNCQLCPIPSAVPKLLKEEPAQVHSTEEEWLNAIMNETKTIIKEKRSIIIFCKSIKGVNLVHQRLQSCMPLLNENNRLHRYTRDYAKFAFEKTELNIEHVIVATNLAGRGTDIKISKQLSDNGGLHVCLTFFADSKRIEEQAMGRAARNGAPGSGILILCKSISDEEKISEQVDTRDLIATMKSKRNVEEIQRITRVTEDFKDMQSQWDLFHRFKEYYVRLKEELKNYGDPESSAICGSVLDQWALWLDDMENLKPDVKKYSYSTKLIKKFEAVRKGNIDVSQIEWMTPARLVVVAKHSAMRKKKSNLLIASKILNQIIHSKDNQFYPTAYYYRAFFLLKENYETNKNEFIKTLRQCENVLNEHINMQISLFSTVQRTMTDRKTDDPLSFCVVDGYSQQKVNIINLFQYFVGSVRSLLGTDCSIEDFAAAGSMPENVKNYFQKNLINFQKWLDEKTEFKVFQKKNKNKDPNKSKISFEKLEEYFKLLLVGESKCIGHQLNSPSTIPSWNSATVEQNAKSNRDMAIERVAIAYGISASTLEKAIEQAVRKDLSKEDIEQELENEIKTKCEKDNFKHCTRESFWEKLVETGALFNNENFLAIHDCDLDTFNLDRNEAITITFDDKNYAIYNPADVINKNGRNEKLIFRKTYVEFTLRQYSRNGNHLRWNKFAKLDIVKLKSVDLKLFGRLTDDDLRMAEISKDERKGIMDELKKQDIINDNGNLSSDYNGQKFKYPNCPAYEDTLMYLVASKFSAEIVRRHWLNRKDNSNHLNAINILPLTPYRGMLDDLTAAYVISGVRVNEMNEHLLEKKVNKITKLDYERNCILDFLKSRKAIYEATWLKEQEIALGFIDTDIRQVKTNTCESELYLFRLMAFDHVMYMKNRQSTTKQMVLTSLFAPLIIIGGVASITTGAFLTIFNKILPFGIAKDLLFMGGLSDIIYVLTTLLSNDQISFSGYMHQRYTSARGETKLVGEGKNLWKLLKSQKSAGPNYRPAVPNYRPAVPIQTDIFHQHRRREERNSESDQQEIVNVLLGLEKISTIPIEEDGNSI